MKTIAAKKNHPKRKRSARRGKIEYIALRRKTPIEPVIENWVDWMKVIGRSGRTIENHLKVVNAWVREEEVSHVESITEKNIHVWINSESDRKASTRQVALGAIRSFCNYCTAKGHLQGDPSMLVRVTFSGLTHNQKEPEERIPFTAAEYKRLMHYLQTESEAAEKNAQVSRRAAQRAAILRFWRIACPISRHTGLRLGDICQLEWSCFTKPGRLIVWTDKRDARVDVPLEFQLTPDLAEAVAGIPIDDRTYCFPAEKELIKGKKRSRLSVYFGSVLKRLEMSHHCFHDLRHTFITECHKKGIPIPNIASTVGHRSVETTRGYVHE